MNKIDASQLLNQMRSMVEEMNANKNVVSKQYNQLDVEKTSGFGEVLKNSLAEINEQQNTASSLSTKFEAGDPNVKLSDVMISIQKAEVSLQGALQVRNKFVSAYQDIINMPI